ncbi:Predicted arabinose efflux permease, MFS family [Micromonospora pattaloongensis]|uniref:Predicted arabinose efflux permease, MFS family n=1 Tax=Micromonospora pattaloongensis TaxID=405436 RepID=A0A1H3RVX7_9ACTN|nr:MFS transporter [Micromonospora pattaloongensis]SDZ29421.1 Predicted arabinose efflux permease, MFS family [Micromonospora pattaloongensis]
MVNAGPATAEPPPSAWAPLRIPAYRNLAVAILATNIGLWMQTVGAQWLLVRDPNASALVAMVQTASMLPILLLALPAGALADTFDRRRLLIAVQCYLAAAAALLTALTAVGRMTPALLLTLTFALGVGQALTLPAWAAIIPELVPRLQLQSASALGAISVNVARSIGPALAGLLIARTGVTVVFAIDTVGFLLFIAALLRWRPGRPGSGDVPERFTSALRAGGRYVRHSPVVRRLLRRAIVFLIPASALWALLPLIASRRLGLNSSGYGLLLAALGIGAIIGGILLPWVRAKLPATRFLVAATLLYGLTLLVVALVRSVPLVLLALLPAGLAWVTVLSNINAEIQLFLPGWVRARGLAVYQVCFAGTQALSAMAWGFVAQWTGLVAAHLAAAVLMFLGAASTRLWPVPDLRGFEGEPSNYWPELRLTVKPDRRVGPVIVTVTYTVRAECEEEFVAAMDVVRESRQRTGAMRWGLFRQGEAGQCFVEIYQLPSWDEHLRQHRGRLTREDQEAEERARALTEGEPATAHLLPAEAT